MAFVHVSRPELGNQYEDDFALRSYLARVLPADVLAEVAPGLKHMGERAGGELYRLQLADRENEPVLTQWDAWSNRVEPHRGDAALETRGASRRRAGARRGGLRAQARGVLRVHQFALAYLFTPSTDLYSCPLAMTDGAARALLAAGNERLTARAVARLTSRDPKRFWTSGQWMTETAGGSDVGLTETAARQENGGWRLYGRKWFTSAITSQMALTLARPEGNPAGGRGLALFYVEDARRAGPP
jgi:alkylation response protein AidB-like acyl-CoA dehydrogenase